MGSTTKVATIASGQSLSTAVDCRPEANAGLSLVRVNLPAGWTAAALTFQVSQDGVTWRNLGDEVGEYQLASAAADRAGGLDLRLFVAVRHLRLRSGTAAAAVNQAAERAIELVFARVAF